MSTPELSLTASPGVLTVADLKHESDLLHLIFHRNKNQHHSSKWWKWLAMLRRNIKKLLEPASVTGVEERLEYMRRVVVPSCYTAFTSVVANNQFAPLGLVLLGALARVHKIVGGEKRARAEKVVVEEAVVVVEEVREERMVRKRDLVVGPVTMEDFGEALQREDHMEEEIGDEEIGEGGVEEVMGEGNVVREDREEMAVLEKETIIVEKKKGEPEFIQETVTGDVVPAIGKPSAKTAKPKESSKEMQSTNQRREKDRKATKKKATKTAPSPSPLPRLPSPSAREGPPKIKTKRKADDKEGAKKKKKRKKGDEIDDLFAGLL